MTKMSPKHKLVAYALHDEMNYPQKDIAALMKVAPSTMSSSIKEARYMVANRQLEQELHDARQYIEEIKDQLPLRNPIIMINEDK